ncbi:MAG: hypothetical protein ACOCZK_04555, partial [Planctomycetota bacterium]
MRNAIIESIIAPLTLLLASTSIGAAEGNLVLRLAGALDHPDLNSAADLVVELAPDRSRGWASDRGYSTALHLVDVLAADAGRLRLRVHLGVDPWRVRGAGTYTVQIPGAEPGSYAGAMTFTGIEGPREVAGACTASRRSAWPEPVEGQEGHVPLRAGEHPRLLVRTPVHESWGERSEAWWAAPSVRALMAALPDSDTAAKPGAPEDGAHVDAANLGCAHLITGDPAFATRAGAILRAAGLMGGENAAPHHHFREDIHLAPVIVAMALAYDSCYDAWDEDLRAECRTALLASLRRLYAATIDGKPMKGTNLAPWSNRNAIRMSGVGVGALALLGDLAPDDPATPLLEEMIRTACYAAREYLRVGIGGSGIGMEGLYYKHMTLARGLSHFLHAAATARGERLASREHDRFLIMGQFLVRDLGELGTITTQAALWPTLWQTAPRRHLPALVDRFGGGPAHEEVVAVRPFFTGLHLATFPHNTLEAERLPLPWYAPDPRKGCHLLRPTPNAPADPLAVVHLKNDLRQSCHYERFGDWPELRVEAFGQRWLAGRFLPQLPHLSTAINPHQGPRLIDSAVADDQAVAFTLDLSPQYWQYLQPTAGFQRRAARENGARLVAHPHWPDVFFDHGVRAERQLLLDFSGRCGAPVLVVCCDRILDLPPHAVQDEPPPAAGGAAPPPFAGRVSRAEPEPTSEWQLPLAEATGEMGRTKAEEDRQLLIGPSDAVHLSAWAVHPSAWANSAGRLVDPEHRYVTLLTIQDGAAPRA